MPTKFKPSQSVFKRGDNKPTITHYYIKQTSKEELIKYINDGQKPKIKQKCLNELTRRGIKIQWKELNQES
mgnify:FL=1|jgi:hypothetical protein